MKSERRIEFQAPPGTVPEGTAAGEEFDLVCTFRVKGPNVCLVQMGDVKMAGYADKPDKGRASYADEHGAMMKGSGGAPTQTGYTTNG